MFKDTENQIIKKLKQVEELAKTNYNTEEKKLNLVTCNFRIEELKLLTRAGFIDKNKLLYLNFYNNLLDAEAMQLLSSQKGLNKLVTLNVCKNKIKHQGLKY